ncbi:hypothetical protein ACFO4E_15580 [Nocardiopsis mangrovi]|uniref:Uncharacterized protein n=1 Tax=Nocardiopsis mangrovi TaxID=1179818 RepID=A0ABV9DXX2_9ACTN
MSTHAYQVTDTLMLSVDDQMELAGAAGTLQGLLRMRSLDVPDYVREALHEALDTLDGIRGVSSEAVWQRFLAEDAERCAAKQQGQAEGGAR